MTKLCSLSNMYDNCNTVHYNTFNLCNYLGANLTGQIEKAMQRAAFANINRSFSFKGLSITLTTLASLKNKNQAVIKR